MKIIRILLVVVGVLLALFVGLNAFLPSKYHVERSITIQAPAATIYPLVADFRNWDQWSPWNLRDTTMVNTYSETPLPNAVEGWHSWTSKNSGNGKQTITALTHPTYVATKLEFEGMGQNTTEFKLVEGAEGTVLTWTFDGETGFFSRWIGLIMDGAIGADYEAGLAKIKELAEATPAIAIETVDIQGFPYFGVRYASDLSDLLADEVLEYQKVMEALKDDSTNIAGKPFVLYESYESLLSVAEYVVAVPYSGSMEKEGFIKAEMPTQRALKVVHTGSPNETQAVLEAVNAHLKANNLSMTGNIWIQFVKADKNTPVAEWVQEIYFPI
jgi:effector-binding domain-containing protein